MRLVPIVKNSGGAAQARWVIAAGGIAVLALAAVYWLAGAPPVPPPTGTTALTIAINPSYAGACPVLAAQTQGFFKAQGLEVTLQSHASGRAALEHVLQGGADLATVADLPVMFAATSGQPVVVIANMFKAERDNGIVARKDRGIAQPVDLRGRRIAVAMGTSPHFVLDAFLNRQGLATTDADIVDMPPGALADALLQGRVDAVATWQPNMDALAARLGANGTVFHGERVYSAHFLLTGTRTGVQARPREVRAVLRALFEGAAFCNEQPVAAAALLTLPQGADAVGLQALWAGYRFVVALEQSLLLALEDEAQWAIGKGLARGPAPNFLDHLDLHTLADVRPSACTVIH